MSSRAHLEILPAILVYDLVCLVMWVVFISWKKSIFVAHSLHYVWVTAAQHMSVCVPLSRLSDLWGKSIVFHFFSSTYFRPTAHTYHIRNWHEVAAYKLPTSHFHTFCIHQAKWNTNPNQCKHIVLSKIHNKA